MLRLRLLGSLDLVSADGRDRSALLAQSKRVALLAYLAAARPHGFHRRDALLPLLWPESDQAHARLALRQALHGLREALGDGVVVSRGDEEVGIDAQSLWCDTVAFDTAVADGAPEEALDLYRGELLQGFFVSSAPEFEQWLERERARLRDAAVSSARALVERAEANGDVAAAVLCARRAVRLAPLDEALVRRLIVLLDRAGDRAGAVESYDAFAHQLAAELDVEPAPETKALIDRVRAREAPSFTEPASATRATSRGLGAAFAPGRPRLHLVRPLPVMALVALAAVAIVLGRRVSAGPELEPRRVVVATFVNRTGDTALTAVGALASDWITDRLVRTGLVQVADPGPDPGGPGSARRTAAGRDARTLALATGAGITISGAVYARGDSIEFQARISDEVHRTLLRGIAPVVGTAHDPRAAVATLSQRVTAALATVIDPKLNELANLASQPPSYEAYRAFAAGADAWYDGDDAGAALRDFGRAARLDPTYTLPLVWAAWAHRARGECDQTDSLGRLLAARPEPLAPVDELYLQRELAFCQGDYAAGYRASRALVSSLPASEAAATELARDALAIGRPREALDALEPLHPDRGALRGHRPYYLFLTTAYHLLGEHLRELAASQRAQRQFPNVRGPLRMELVALAALGREREVLTKLADMARPSPSSRRSPADLMREAALELRAHGHPQAGREVLRRALSWEDSRPEAERATEASSGERLRLLYAAERWDEARILADRLVAEHPDNARYQGLRGALAAQRGDRDQAVRAERLLAARWTRPPSRGEAALWRACIAARLGDSTEAMALLQGVGELGWGIGRDNGNLWLMTLHTEPCFDSLRGSPAFEALLRSGE